MGMGRLLEEDGEAVSGIGKVRWYRSERREYGNANLCNDVVASANCTYKLTGVSFEYRLCVMSRYIYLVSRWRVISLS